MWGHGDAGFFDRIAPLYRLVHIGADEELYRSAFAAADGEVETVLDLAGGTGRVSATVTDLSPVVLDASRGMLRQVPTGVAAIRGDAASLPLRDGSIDAALCVDALHHVPRQSAAIEEVHRVLRPGGVFLVVEFDPATVRGRLAELFEDVVGMDSRFLSPDRTDRLLAEAGFAVERVSGGFEYVVAGKKD